ncbi:MAG: hypothetical protein JW704_01945 [Anaerolineaceae bacterium]|nr:hypothetical protein [Anaerolineaceae bacterium]
MLIILPAALLIATIILMAVMQHRDVSRGLIWSAGAVGSLAAMLVSFFLLRALPLEVAVRGGTASLYGKLPLSINLDGFAWAFQTALLVILNAVILTATRRQASGGPPAWLASIAIAVLGLVAIQAGTLSTLLTAWFLIDTLELAFLLSSLKMQHNLGNLATSYAMRYTAILVGMIVLIGFNDTSNTNADTFMFLAAMLRLGALPFWPYWGDARSLTGLGTMLQAVRVFSVMTPLARLGSNAVPPGWVGLFTLYCLLLMLYCAIRWLRLDSIQEGRAYWITAYNLAAGVCIIHGQSAAVMPWIVTSMLAGSALFLFTDRSRLSISLVLANMVALTGLPFTPVASGWFGLLGSPADWRAIPFLLVIVLFLLGSLRLMLKTPESGIRVEGLARFTYPAGLILLMSMPWMIVPAGSNQAHLEYWWAGFVTFALLLIVIIVFRAQILEDAELILPDNRFWNASRRLFDASLSAIQQDWLVNVFNGFSGLIGRIVNAITSILEGDGGVLWVFLLLALFATLLSVQGGL